MKSDHFFDDHLMIRIARPPHFYLLAHQLFVMIRIAHPPHFYLPAHQLPQFLMIRIAHLHRFYLLQSNMITLKLCSMSSLIGNLWNYNPTPRISDKVAVRMSPSSIIGIMA